MPGFRGPACSGQRLGEMWHERPFPVEAPEGLPFRQVYVLSISLFLVILPLQLFQRRRNLLRITSFSPRFLN